MGALAVTMKEPEKQEASKTSEDLHDRKTRINTQHQIVILKSFCLTNRQLVATGEIPYAETVKWNTVVCHFLLRLSHHALVM